MHSGTCHPQVPCYCQRRCHLRYLSRIYLSSDSTVYSVMTEPVNPLELPIDKWAFIFDMSVWMPESVEVKHYSSSVTFASSIINCGSL